jgi:hypothetical protein
LRRLEEINREPHEIRENILTRISRIGANSNGGKTLFVTGMFGSTPILNRIAQTIVVEDVYELFIGIYAPSDSGTAVMLDWNGKVLGNNPLDYIGLVAKDGVPVGTIEYSEVEEDRSIWATMEKISMKSIVAVNTPLIEAAKLFNEKSPYIFWVLQRNELVGWMSYRHLLGIPFRACLFSWLLAIEQAMLEVALTNPVLAVTKLGSKRAKSLKGRIKNRGSQLSQITERDLLNSSLFSDKLRIIKGCSKTAASIPALHDKLLNEVEEVRNSLAHPSADYRLFRILSKDRLHIFLTWLTKLETELRNYLDAQSLLED